MATGLRIGEACGLTWNAVDLDTGLVEVKAAAVRVRGEGLAIKSTKTDAGRRTLILPRWCTDLAVNARSTRSGRVSGPAPGTVVRGPSARVIPRSPRRRINRSTVQRATECPRG